MAEGIFRVRAVGGDELRRVLGQAQAAAATATRAVARESRRASGEEIKLARDELAAKYRERKRAADADAKLERDRTRAKLKELADQKKADATAAREYERAQKQASRIAASSARARSKTAKDEEREQARVAKAILVTRQAAEREVTKIQARETRERLRDSKRASDEEVRQARQELAVMNRDRRRAATEAKRIDRDRGAVVARGGAFGRRVAERTLGAFSSLAGGLHSEIQEARARGAVAERNVGSAVYQAGGTREDVVATMGSLRGFAGENKMDVGEVAAALNAAQTEFSVLEPGPGETRAQKLAQFKRNALLARNTGQDVGEVTRLGGMLGKAGITGPQQLQTLYAMTGMAQKGAIELGDVTRTALGPIQRRMGTALSRLGPGASAAQRAHAQQQAVLQAMAEMEVGKGLGLSPQNMGNVMDKIEGRLTSPTVQGRMLTNIRSYSGLSAAQRRHAEATLFDKKGHLKADYAASPFGLAKGLQGAFAGNSEAMRNVFTGGGHGNPMSLLSNERNVLAALMGGGGAGTDNDRIQKLLGGVGTDFTAADEARGAGVFGSDEASAMTAAQTAHDNALSGNSTALNTLSKTIADWKVANPWLSAVGTTAGGIAGAAVVGKAGQLIGKGAARVGGMLGGAGGALATAGTWAAGGLGALAAGVGAGGAINAGINAVDRRVTGRSSEGYGTFDARPWKEFANLVADAIHREPLTVRTDAHSAAHIDSLNARGGKGTR